MSTFRNRFSKSRISSGSNVDFNGVIAFLLFLYGVESVDIVDIDNRIALDDARDGVRGSASAAEDMVVVEENGGKTRWWSSNNDSSLWKACTWPSRDLMGMPSGV